MRVGDFVQHEDGRKGRIIGERNGWRDAQVKWARGGESYESVHALRILIDKHTTGMITDERFSATDYPMLTVWGLKEQGFCYVPATWPQARQRAEYLSAVAMAVEAEEPCSKRVSTAIAAAVDGLRHEFDLRPQECSEDLPGWATATSLLASLIERAYVRNHSGKP